MNSRLRKILVVVSLALIILGEWIMWEAVVKPLKDTNPASWSMDFPSPFYVFTAPIWFWHDLSITLVVVCGCLLAFLALDKDKDKGGVG